MLLKKFIADIKEKYNVFHSKPAYEGNRADQFTFEGRTRSSNSFYFGLLNNLPLNLQKTPLQLKCLIDVGIGMFPHPTFTSLQKLFKSAPVSVKGIELDKNIIAPQLIKEEAVIPGNILELSTNEQLAKLINQADLISIRNLAQFHFTHENMQSLFKKLAKTLKEGALVIITERRKSPNEKGFVYQQCGGQLVIKNIITDINFSKGALTNSYKMSTGKINPERNVHDLSSSPIIDSDFFIVKPSETHPPYIDYKNKFTLEYEKYQDQPIELKRRMNWQEAWKNYPLKNKLQLLTNKNHELWQTTYTNKEKIAQREYLETLETEGANLKTGLLKHIINHFKETNDWKVSHIGEMLCIEIPKDYYNRNYPEIFIPEFFKPEP